MMRHRKENKPLFAASRHGAVQLLGWTTPSHFPGGAVLRGASTVVVLVHGLVSAQDLDDLVDVDVASEFLGQGLSRTRRSRFAGPLGFTRYRC